MARYKQKKPTHYALIMAGGRGTRFWPRSRKKSPKQVLNVAGELSLIQQTAERIGSVIPPERIWVLTNPDTRPAILRQLPQIPKQQIIAEPAQRNTAPCNALAAHILHNVDPEAIVGVFPADHIVTRQAPYRRVVRSAWRAAESGALVVVGIRPRWPETGYGYIELPSGVQAGAQAPVLHFREKPDLPTAEQYVAAGNYYWNSGMFFWRAAAFLEAVRRHQPQTATLLASLPAFSSRRFARALAETYPRCTDISVDYAIYEKAGDVLGIVAEDFGWNDVGSWNALYELLPRDSSANVVRGEALALESTGNYVDAQRKLVVLIGAKDLVVVDTPDALLIADRNQAQQVSQVVKQLEKRQRDDLL